MKKLSEHAHAAKLIRKELKKTYPLTKFSVRSESYSGGTSVSIDWEDGPTYENVMNLVGKYQDGHFDSSSDIYVYSKNENNIPKVKYVFSTREISKNVEMTALEVCKKRYVFFDKVNFINDWLPSPHMECANHFIFRYLSKIFLPHKPTFDFLENCFSEIDRG